MVNYYEILKVINFADDEVIKASYKALSKKYHPDINKNVDPNIMVGINLAYEVLSDSQKRNQYDLKLREYFKQTENRSTKSEFEFSSNNQKNDSVNTETKVGKFTKIVSNSIGFITKSFINEMSLIKKETENAYYRGSNMPNDVLVKKYMRSNGSQRNGYAQALIDRGLLYKENGRLVPSHSFKKISK